jgi:nucleotide-binding universal stress UspA family protein
MFKHVLIPTDGSTLSQNAIKHAVGLAKHCGAKLSALNVMPKFHVLTYDAEMLEATPKEFEKTSKEQSKQFLDFAQQEARAAGVDCEAVTVASDHPYQEIINTAQQRGCDLIVMASHGRRGLEGVLIGSETQKVLTHSHVPVLVYR